MPSTDPFYLVKDDIQASLDKAQTRYLQWQSSGKTGPGRKKLEVEIDEECSSISWQVDEVEKAVNVAEANMARFGLTQQEVVLRRKWVIKTKQQCESIMKGLKNPQQREDELTGHTATSRLGAAIRSENDRHIASEQEQQQMLLRQQDQDLSDLGDHVVKIGQMGRQIGEELGQQSELIDELDADMDGITNRLAAAQKKMTIVLKKAGLRGQLVIIAVLIVLLVVLLLIAFS